MDARVRATQGAVAEEPEVTAGGRIASGTAIEDAVALQQLEIYAYSCVFAPRQAGANLFLSEPLGCVNGCASNYKHFVSSIKTSSRMSKFPSALL